MGIDAEHGHMVSETASNDIAINGAGPAGLFAAEIIASAGLRVTIYERMPSPARKFLLAGRGGLNLTHSEPLEDLLARYGGCADEVRAVVKAFPPSRLIDWANGLDAQTFIGTKRSRLPQGNESLAIVASLAAPTERPRRHDQDAPPLDRLLRSGRTAVRYA